MPQDVYSTKCTGKSIELLEGNQSKKIYLDCKAGERSMHVIDNDIKSLIEKLRCLLGDKIVITSGYRSAKHNIYSWAYVVKKTGKQDTVSKKSKHQFGKAVDFYVQGLGFNEHKKLLPKLQSWAGKFETKLRGSREKIWTKAYLSTEGRDPDNLHNSPYIHIELRK